MTEIERLRITLEGDASPYLSSLREAEGATRKTATQLEGQTTAATKAVAASQTQLAASYAQTGQAAVVAAGQQVSAATTAAAASQQAAAATAAHAAAMAKGVEVFKSVRTPVEQYRDRIGELDKLLKQGAISQDTFSRAAKKAADETGQSGGTLGKAMGGLRAGMGKALPMVALAAGALKVADTIADWVNNTAKFRAELIAAGRAGDELADSMNRANQARLKSLDRDDAPIQQRRLKIEKELAAAEAERERRRRTSDAAAEQVRRDEESTSVKGLADEASKNPLAAGLGVFRWAKNKLTGGQDRERNKTELENAKKYTAESEALVKQLRDKRTALEEGLKDLAFQQQAASRENIALARIPEHLRGGEKLRRMGAKDADVKETQRLATDEMTTKFSADTDKASRMLKLQAQNLTATSNELRVMEMALEGASEKQLALAKASAQANKQAELQLTIAQTNKGLREQIDVLGKSASFAQLYGLKVKGASDADLALTKALGQQLRGRELKEQFMTPPEKFIKSMNELNELYQSGALDQKTYARAAQDARKQLEGQRQELQAIQGAAGGSAEALERFNKFQDQIKIKPIPGIEDMQRVVQAQQFRMAGGVAQGQAGGLGVGGVLAQGPMAMERNPPMMQGNQQQANEYLRRIAEAVEAIMRRPAINLGLGLGGN